ncbi:metal-dependent transcriptional regulator [Methanomicrobium antiquum]|uniref:Metal-dependent transcriptional regulator n=1 Tax=Methanomicrobium antiquum TaxID=487686 RepID=A0AAF0FVD5_9EURY|nr:metal-dependent transcriptional regulator [Methanomicrobium antiquum]MDD3977655.1 metal-dependent transcriptional regulator [Methanomicrobium sp.]WFN36635.1 metal-dependent transcriptional regulator [Methanomicrobium antiquum]
MSTQNCNLSRKAEDYLEAILNVSLEKGYAKTRDIAKELNVSPPSVVEMFIKLDRLGLIEYRKYEGVILKPKGREIASVIKYRHETLMSFLKLISVPDKIADEDACLMEHELNPKTIEQIHLFVDFLNERGSKTHTLQDFDEYCAVRRNAETADK